MYYYAILCYEIGLISKDKKNKSFNKIDVYLLFLFIYFFYYFFLLLKCSLHMYILQFLLCIV